MCMHDVAISRHLQMVHQLDYTSTPSVVTSVLAILAIINMECANFSNGLWDFSQVIGVDIGAYTLRYRLYATYTYVLTCPLLNVF